MEWLLILSWWPRMAVQSKSWGWNFLPSNECNIVDLLEQNGVSMLAGWHLQPQVPNPLQQQLGPICNWSQIQFLSCQVSSHSFRFGCRLCGAKASNKIGRLTLPFSLFYFHCTMGSTCQAHSTPVLQSTALHILFWGIWGIKIPRF